MSLRDCLQLIPIHIALAGTAIPSTLFNTPRIAALNNTMVHTGNIVLETASLLEGTLDLTGVSSPLIIIRLTGQLFLQFMVRQ